ncbi:MULTISPECIES: hypothetical protein [unclassified Streptomyces]|uniref:hypothetical protein n=1 Tax=unclassified Streptomyces TaxID=2593676 RepID=UPI0024733A0E|nr:MULTISPECIES: hypothetical protein [unclassified Streptomyces]MDH6448852.1 hypothetical protein [Streptomyces sp. SAI-119]MDH6500567.1 hypothetical protein [Streptomyces sp. SAI-149]
MTVPIDPMWPVEIARRLFDHELGKARATLDELARAAVKKSFETEAVVAGGPAKAEALGIFAAVNAAKLEFNLWDPGKKIQESYENFLLDRKLKKEGADYRSADMAPEALLGRIRSIEGVVAGLKRQMTAAAETRMSDIRQDAARRQRILGVIRRAVVRIAALERRATRATEGTERVSANTRAVQAQANRLENQERNLRQAVRQLSLALKGANPDMHNFERKLLEIRRSLA